MGSIINPNTRCKSADGKFIKTSLCKNENCKNKENHPSEKLKAEYEKAVEKACELGICNKSCHSSKCENYQTCETKNNSDFSIKQAVFTAIGIVLVILVFIGLKSL